MKLITMTLISGLASSAAFAHNGAHIHPHGIDTLVLALIAAAAASAIAAVAILRK